MPFDITEALSQGFDRTIQRNGLLFAGILFVLSALNALLVQLFVPAVPMPTPGAPGAMPDPDPGAILTASLVSLAFALVSMVVVVAAIRTFVTPETEEIPPAYFRRNLGWTLLNLIVGGIVFGVVVAIGFVLLIVPGLFLLVSLYFWNVAVIVDDENFVEGFQTSWELTGGHRLRLFGLGVAVVLISAVVTALFAIPAAFLGVLGTLLTQIGSALVSVFTLATTARAYVQLVGLEESEPAEPFTV